MQEVLSGPLMQKQAGFGRRASTSVVSGDERGVAEIALRHLLMSEWACACCAGRDALVVYSGTIGASHAGDQPAC